MSISVPRYDVDQATLGLQRTTLINDLQDMLSPVAGSQPMVARDLRPTDLNNGTLIGQLDNPALTADVYANDVYSTWTKLLATQVLGLLGFADISGAPLIDELTFTASGQTLGIQVIDLTYADTVDNKVFFFPPLVWTFNEHMFVNLLSHKGGSAHVDAFQWIGVIVETQSVVVPPREIGINKKIPGFI